MELSKQRRQDIISALRRGTVPRSSLDKFAVGLGRFEDAIEQELSDVKVGRAVFKACLLYTSPSPRDQRGSRMPSSA